MKRSDDGGRTWSELLPVPENWTQAKNCPALYRLTDPKGTTRLFVFAGRGPDKQMQQSMSLDEGRTWTPMKSNGLECVMPFTTIAPVDRGQRLIALSSIRRASDPGDTRANILAQSESTDGGLTWFNQPRSTIKFTPSSGYDPLLNKVYMGDYISLVAAGSNFYAAWTDTRNRCTPPGGAPRPCSPAS